MRVLVLQGHPDPQGGHFGHALAQAYADAARDAGHEVKTLQVARLDFPLLRSATEWDRDAQPRAIQEAQEAIRWAAHLAIFFPLWLGDMPAHLKGFFEQCLRPGFAIGRAQPGRLGKKLLKGRSARIVVTMGMPALFYRLYYRSHSLKSLKRNVLGFCGVDPVRTTTIGTVEGPGETRKEWLAAMEKLGRAAR